MTDFTICCTDKGSHGRITIEVLKVRADGTLTQVRPRLAKAPWRAGSTVTGTFGAETYSDAAPAHYVAMTDDAREDHAGRERWRFVCDKCGRDTVLTGGNLRKAVSGLLATRRRSLDVSLLPK